MIRVLVVDDDFRVAQVHASYVEAAGSTVVGIVHTAASALQAIRDLDPDLVLLDNYLPDAPGLEVARELAGTDVGVLMVTADNDVESVRRALGAGAVNYLIKPFAQEQLRARLTAYARYRSRLAVGPASQDQVDAAMAALRAGDAPATPKGQSPVTARLIREHLQAAGGAVTAAEVASELGLGRATAQRYLAALVGDRVATMRLRYGSTGRPEHEYRWSG